MTQALQKKVKSLIKKVKNHENQYQDKEKIDAFIKALEEASSVALSLEVDDPYYKFLNDLNTCIIDIYEPEKDKNITVEALKVLIEEQGESDEETQVSNRQKAIALLVLATVEFIVLGLLLGTLIALAGAVILGVGFAVAAFFSIKDPVIIQNLASIGALCGAIVGCIIGLITAGVFTYFSLQYLKTTDWANFKTHDSLWDLAIHGKGKQELITEKIGNNYSFFNNGAVIKPLSDPTIDSVGKLETNLKISPNLPDTTVNCL